MTVATIILLVILGIFILFGIINGAKNGFGKQSVNLIFDAVAIVVSALIAMPITTLLCDLLYDKIIPNIDFASLGLSAEFIGEYGVTLASMLVSPLVFGIVFLLIALICKIPALIICKAAWGSADEREEPSGASKIGGVLIGILTAGAVFISLIAPIAGYASSVSTVLNTPTEENKDSAYVISDTAIADSNSKVLQDLINGLKEVNPVLDIVNKAGGQIIFNQVTTAKIGETNVSLGKEVQVIGEIVSMLPKGENFKVEDLLKDDKLIEGIGEKLSESKFLTSMGSDLIGEAYNSLSEGKNFLGIPAPDKDSTEGQLVLNVLDNFKDCTPDTVADQVKSVTKTIATVQKHGIIEKLTKAEGDDAVMDVLSDPELVGDLIDCIFDNEIMSNTILDFAASFAKTFFKDNNIGPISEADEAKIVEKVNDILTNISSKKTDDEKIAYVKAELKSSFKSDANIELNDEILGMISTFISEYSKVKNVEKANAYIIKLVKVVIAASR